jgi:ABC-type nitrate/sulfonate/bicarbonate transport system substrate-binding protein
MKIVVPDLISNSYFPAVAAVELGCFKEGGLDAEVELLFPVDAAYAALAAGEVDLVAGSAHSALAAFPDWSGVKLLAAQAQGMYWFLVMRADLGAERGDLEVVKGRRIGAAPWVDLGLAQLLTDAGIDLAADRVEIAPVPGAKGAGTNFGLTAARALEAGTIDGFWANGMAAEMALRSGAGTLVLDVRRGDGPARCFDYTFASIAVSAASHAADPGRSAAAVVALRRAQAALVADPEIAAEVAERVFPPEQAALIGGLIRRDAPFYDATIGEAAVAGMSRFARERDLTKVDADYEDLIATDLAALWTA